MIAPDDAEGLATKDRMLPQLDALGDGFELAWGNAQKAADEAAAPHAESLRRMEYQVDTIRRLLCPTLPPRQLAPDEAPYNVRNPFAARLAERIRPTTEQDGPRCHPRTKAVDDISEASLRNDEALVRQFDKATDFLAWYWEHHRPLYHYFEAGPSRETVASLMLNPLFQAEPNVEATWAKW